MNKRFLGPVLGAMVIASSSATSAQEPNDQLVCQHTTEPAFSWTLEIGAGGKSNAFEFVPRNSSMNGASGKYDGDCTEDECTAEKPTVTGDTTYRTVLRVDRLAGVAQITQYQANGDIWSKWQATCQKQDGSSDQ